MIFGNSEFSITYDVVQRHKSGRWIYGFFNIMIDGNPLIHNDSTFTLNSIISYLKKTITDIEVRGLNDSFLVKEVLYTKASETRGYYTFRELELAHLLDKNPDDKTILKKLDEYEAKFEDAPFGIEICLYVELLDCSWRFFLFGANEKERLIYSKDAGRTVFEKILPRGTVEQVIRSLPNSDGI